MKEPIIKTDGASYYTKLVSQYQKLVSQYEKLVSQYQQEYPYEDGPDMRNEANPDICQYVVNKAHIEDVISHAKRELYIENEELRKKFSNIQTILWLVFMAIIILGVKVFLAQ